LNSLLSIDIGTRNFHIVEGTSNRNNVTITRAASFEIPEGCIHEEFIDNEDRLVEQIRDAIHKTGFSAKEVVLTINACNAIVRDMDFPDAKPKEIDSMIRNELYQTFNVLTTDVIQYKMIERVTNDVGVSLNRYRVCAIDADLVDSYHNIIQGLRMKTLAMDINTNAIDKLFSGNIIINENPLDNEAVMLIDVGGVFTTIYICTAGKPLFYRHLKIGSSEIEKIIGDNTVVPVAEARRMKEEGYDFFSNADNDAQKYFELLKPYFYRFNDEIRKIISFYSSRNNAAPVNRAYLFGSGSQLTGLTDYWCMNLNMPFERIRSLANIKTGSSGQLDPAHINAAGALIRY